VVAEQISRQPDFMEIAAVSLRWAQISLKLS
jgi:hypothetical protein